MIVFEPLFPDVTPPQAATAWSAGLDLRAYLGGRQIVLVNPDNCPVARQAIESVTIPPGHRALIPLGFKARLPEGYEMQIRARSGRSFKEGLIVANGPGTVDADYSDEWGVILLNTSMCDVIVRHGERVAQAVLARVERLDWQPGSVTAVTDRVGGLGSTGL